MRIHRDLLIGFIRDPAMILALCALGLLRVLIALYRAAAALKGQPSRSSDRLAEHTPGSVILRTPERPKKMTDILIQQ